MERTDELCGPGRMGRLQHRLAKRSQRCARIGSAHHLAGGFAGEPGRAAVVPYKPAPAACTRLAPVMIPPVRDRAGATDERDPNVEAGRGQDEPGVVHDRDPGARQQAGEQVRQTFSSGRDLGSGAASAARVGPDRAQPAQ